MSTISTSAVSSSREDAAKQLGVEAWLVGNWQQHEFADLQAKIPASETWEVLDGLAAASQLAAGTSGPPELIFLAQAMPGEFAQADIDRLQQQLPLARIVVVAGTWCEGELRTGEPLSGVIRLYWYELATWWQAAARRLDEGLCPLWSLPLNDVRSGRWSADGDSLGLEDSLSAILVDTHDYATYQTLSGALQPYEIRCEWTRGEGSPSESARFDAGIWDGGQLGAAECSQLAGFCQRQPGPVIALLDFPRREHFHQAKEAGAAAVLAKPYVVEELVAELTKHLRQD